MEIDKEWGTPTRFVVRLERCVDGDWREVARFDHDSEKPMGYDVTEERLYMDVYRDGEKVDVVDSFPLVSLSDAPAYCFAYLKEHAGALLERFELWHDLNQGPSGGRSR